MVTCHTSLRRFAQCGSLLAWVCLPTEDHLDTEEYWDGTFHRRDVALENVHISYTHTVIKHRQTNHRELPGFLDWQDYSRFCLQCNNCVRITIRIRSFVFLTTASPRSPEMDVDIRCKWGFQSFLNLLSLQQCKWTNEDHKTVTFMACFILLHHLLGKVKWNKKQEVKILVQCIFTPIWNRDKLLLVLVPNANKQMQFLTLSADFWRIKWGRCKNATE